MATTTFMCCSPSSGNTVITVPTPVTRNGIRNAMAKAGDTSWDVVVISEDGSSGRRVPRAQRPAARKLLLGDMMDDEEQSEAKLQKLMSDFMVEVEAKVESVKAAVAAEKSERIDDLNYLGQRLIGVQTQLIEDKQLKFHDDSVTEKYECFARCIQGFNDIVFDTSRPDTIDDEEKKKLKANGLGYISRLLAPGTDLDAEIQALRTRALDVLTSEQQSLCLSLMILQDQIKLSRHSLHHPRPNISTAMALISPSLTTTQEQITLWHFLASNPKHLPTSEDDKKFSTDLYLFEGATYEPVAKQGEMLSSLKVNLSYDEDWLNIRRDQVDFF